VFFKYKSILCVRLKTHKKALNKSLGEKSPSLVTPLVTFNLL
jgi:hypothetical protein